MKKTILGAMAAVALCIAAQSAVAQESYHPTLYEGWNLTVGTGETPEQLIEREPCVDWIYGWDADAQGWKVYFDPEDVSFAYLINSRGGLAGEALSPMYGYWIHTTGGCSGGA